MKRGEATTTTTTKNRIICHTNNVHRQSIYDWVTDEYNELTESSMHFYSVRIFYGSEHTEQKTKTQQIGFFSRHNKAKSVECSNLHQ